MTIVKAALGCLFFFVTIVLTGGFSAIPLKYAGTFFLSGFIALGFGDILMLKSFADLGPARTILLYGFQPLVIGLISFFLFGQTVSLVKLCSIIFFLICIFIFSLESFRRHGHWSVKAMALACAAMLTDSAGILLTRYSFDGSCARVMEGNFYRTVGAIASFVLLGMFVKLNFWGSFAKMKKREISLAALGSFLGVYLCLIFYLTAIKHGNLAAVSGISVTGAIFAAVFECVFERKWPSKYLLSAFVFFGAGMYLLLFI